MEGFGCGQLGKQPERVDRSAAEFSQHNPDRCQDFYDRSPLRNRGFLQGSGRSCDRGSRNGIIVADTESFLALANPLSNVHAIAGLK